MRRRAPARRVARSRPSLRGAISALSAASLTAIVAVLVLVSLPRLRSFVCIENEAEARETARTLARALARIDDEELSGLSIRELVSQSEGLRFSGEPAYLDDARVLRMHGYLFTILPCAPTVALPPEHEDGTVLAGEPAAGTGSVAAPRGYVVRAWPWRCGRTGRRAFLAFPGGELLRSTESLPIPEGPSASRTPVEDLRGWRRRP